MLTGMSVDSGWVRAYHERVHVHCFCVPSVTYRMCVPQAFKAQGSSSDSSRQFHNTCRLTAAHCQNHQLSDSDKRAQ